MVSRIGSTNLTRAPRQFLATTIVCVFVCTSAVGCGADQTQVSPGPVKKDGSRSTEFEQDDIERADDASDAVKDYCSGAVSEAQRLGCESHVDESDIP